MLRRPGRINPRKPVVLSSALLLLGMGLVWMGLGSYRQGARLDVLFTPLGQFLTPAEVGGLGGLYLVDTGSARTLVSPEVAAKLKLTGANVSVESGLSGGEPLQALIVLTGAVRFASWRLRFPEEVLVLDVQPLASRLEQPVDGILGWDVLREYVLGFDARQKRFLGGKNVSAARLLADLGVEGTATALPLRLVGDLPCVSARCNGQEATLVLDTGCGRTLFTQAAWRRLVGDPPEDSAEREVWTIDGGTSGRDTTLDELFLGSIRMHGVPVVVTTGVARPPSQASLFDSADGLLGMDVLAGLIVSIDGPKRMLHVAPRPAD